MAIAFPDIDPVAIHFSLLGKLPLIGESLAPYVEHAGIRWYSLAYIAGIMLGWWVVAAEHKRRPIVNLTRKALDDMVMWAVIGIVGGGRLGYVLFYKPDYYLTHPTQILHVWEGGMAFHGGLVGVILVFFAFSRKYHISFWTLIDIIACATPIGLCTGRLANFINGELWGRITDAPWGVVFPAAVLPDGSNPARHPSQLYEAALEGVVLWAILMFMLKCTRARDKPGMLGGTFIGGYAIARMIVECFREPDSFLGFFPGHVTMGQLLCVPMLTVGAYLVLRPNPARLMAREPA